MGFSRIQSAFLWIALLIGSIVMGGYRYQAESIDVDQDGDVDMNDLFKIFSVIFFSGYGLVVYENCWNETNKKWRIGWRVERRKGAVVYTLVLWKKSLFLFLINIVTQQYIYIRGI